MESDPRAASLNTKKDNNLPVFILNYPSISNARSKFHIHWIKADFMTVEEAMIVSISISIVCSLQICVSV